MIEKRRNSRLATQHRITFSDSSLAVSDSKSRHLPSPAFRLNLTPLKINSTRVHGTHVVSPPMPPGATGPVFNHAGSPPMPPGATGPAFNHPGSPPMPPGATGPALNHTASSSRSNSYPQMTLNAMLNSPARLLQPHLHPDKLNGALCKISTGSLSLMTWSTKQASATGEPPSYTALVTQAEMEATQLSNTEGSPGSPSASSAPSRLMLNKAYLKSKRGYVYGLGSEQYREHAPSTRIPNGLARNLELEMRVGGLETSLQRVTADVAGVKQDVAGVKQDVSDMRQDFSSTREAINQLLQTLRPPQAPTGQTSDQPQAPTAQPNPPNGI
ncbi:hypothetical protein HID58_006476 [Brassica napus]|uniref:Uncharacterized protein n=1 Tax=Brassica napus TaxID=3708 RepID=A0ABQ8EBN1_BRANA|nr:hypothetical protein HID58_006476 [Brassica napus]